MLKRLLFLFAIERIGFYIYREIVLIKARKKVNRISDDMHMRTTKSTT